MGFSLARFFEELEEILSDTSIDDNERIMKLDTLIGERKEYAKECNQI